MSVSTPPTPIVGRCPSEDSETSEPSAAPSSRQPDRRPQTQGMRITWADQLKDRRRGNTEQPEDEKWHDSIGSTRDDVVDEQRWNGEERRDIEAASAQPVAAHRAYCRLSAWCVPSMGIGHAAPATRR